MTTDRPYRKQLPVEEACRRLREGSGSQFDPQVVEVFLALRGELWSSSETAELLAS